MRFRPGAADAVDHDEQNAPPIEAQGLRRGASRIGEWRTRSRSRRPYGVAPRSPEDYAVGVVEETNAARAAEGLDALATSDCAATEARARAEALRGQPLEHASLRAVQDACDPPSGLTAENLSRAAAAPADVVQAWLDSPGHRNNVLSPELTQVGVACVTDGDDGEELMLCSQVFLG
jgi:uncharacterized protein YkwD